jgi:hypothetical protein
VVALHTGAVLAFRVCFAKEICWDQASLLRLWHMPCILTRETILHEQSRLTLFLLLLLLLP